MMIIHEGLDCKKLYTFNSRGLFFNAFECICYRVLNAFWMLHPWKSLFSVCSQGMLTLCLHMCWLHVRVCCMQFDFLEMFYACLMINLHRMCPELIQVACCIQFYCMLNACWVYLESMPNICLRGGVWGVCWIHLECLLTILALCVDFMLVVW
jgi:hypothetical protein